MRPIFQGRSRNLFWTNQLRSFVLELHTHKVMARSLPTVLCLSAVQAGYYSPKGGDKITPEQCCQKCKETKGCEYWTQVHRPFSRCVWTRAQKYAWTRAQTYTFINMCIDLFKYGCRAITSPAASGYAGYATVLCARVPAFTRVCARARACAFM